MNETTATPTPDEVTRQRLFAMALCDVDEIEPARMVLEDTLDTHPGDLDVLGDLAAVYLRAGRWDACIRTARDVLASAPDDDESAYALAMALGASGCIDEAVELHRDLTDGARAARFTASHPELAALCRAEVDRLLAVTR
jgi:thioredoxin-like negative regulator of GroEL